MTKQTPGTYNLNALFKKHGKDLLNAGFTEESAKYAVKRAYREAAISNNEKYAHIADLNIGLALAEGFIAALFSISNLSLTMSGRRALVGVLGAATALAIVSIAYKHKLTNNPPEYARQIDKKSEKIIETANGSKPIYADAEKILVRRSGLVLKALLP
jgi:hypothetical protein